LLMLWGISGAMVIAFFSYPMTRVYSGIMLMLQLAVVIGCFSEVFRVKKTVSLNGIKVYMMFVIFLSATVLYAGFQQLNGEIHSKQLLIAKNSRNFPRMFREAEKAESFFYPVDMFSTPIEWYKGMAFFYNKQVERAKECFMIAEKINPY